MKIQYKGAIALAIVVFEISLWSIFLQIGGSKIGILPELFYGFLVGSIVCILISLVKDRGKGLISIIRKPDMFIVMLIAGLLNDIFTQLFLGIGTLGTNPTIGSIVFRSWVIIVALLTPFVLRQKVRSKQLFATLIGFLGVYIILSGGTLFTFSSIQTPFVGILLIAAFCSALSILIMNKYTVDTVGAIAIFNVASFVVAAILILITHSSINVVFTPSIIFSILFLGIVAYGIGTMLFYYSVKVLGSLTTGNSILFVPFLTIVFSFFIVGTQIKAYYLLAAVLTTIGIILQRKYSALPQRITKNNILNQLFIFDITGAFAGNDNYKIRSNTAGANRAFAVKFSDSKFKKDIYSAIFVKHNCIAFTNAKPHKGVKPEELKFINKVMKAGKGDTILVGIGSPGELESSFEELVSVPGFI